MNMRKAMKDTLALLKENSHDLCTFEEEGLNYTHLVSMYNRIMEADANNEPYSEAKIGRWLGWMQGVATASGYMTLSDAKRINKAWADTHETPSAYPEGSAV